MWVFQDKTFKNISSRPIVVSLFREELRLQGMRMGRDLKAGEAEKGIYSVWKLRKVSGSFTLQKLTQLPPTAEFLLSGKPGGPGVLGWKYRNISSFLPCQRNWCWFSSTKVSCKTHFVANKIALFNAAYYGCILKNVFILSWKKRT